MYCPTYRVWYQGFIDGVKVALIMNALSRTRRNRSSSDERMESQQNSLEEPGVVRDLLVYCNGVDDASGTSAVFL